jgi:hypothetical protein
VVIVVIVGELLPVLLLVLAVLLPVLAGLIPLILALSGVFSPLVLALPGVLSPLVLALPGVLSPLVLALPSVLSPLVLALPGVLSPLTLALLCGGGVGLALSASAARRRGGTLLELCSALPARGPAPARVAAGGWSPTERSSRSRTARAIPSAAPGRSTGPAERSAARGAAAGNAAAAPTAATATTAAAGNAAAAATTATAAPTTAAASSSRVDGQDGDHHRRDESQSLSRLHRPPSAGALFGGGLCVAAPGTANGIFSAPSGGVNTNSASGTSGDRFHSVKLARNCGCPSSCR